MTFYSLQALRFVAALLVLLFHLLVVPSGYKGVDIFFVISGTVMYYTLYVKPRHSLWHFAVNRFTKIYFLYWVALLFLYAVAPFSIAPDFYRTLFLLPGHQSVIGVSWSLSYELYFYTVLGLVAYLIPRPHHKKIFCLCFFIATAVTVITTVTSFLKGSALNFFLGANAWEFLLGIAAGFLVFRSPACAFLKFAWLVSIASGLLLLLVSIPYATPVSYVVYGSLSFLLVGSGVAYEKYNGNFLPVNSFMSKAGEASYGIYLFGPVITILAGRGLNILITVSTICFALFFSVFIENPFLRWIRGNLY